MKHFPLFLVLASSLISAQQIKLHSIKKHAASLGIEFLQELTDIFTIDTFVETGTYMGDTTKDAANVFKTVHSIELSNALYRRARNIFNSNTAVQLHHGDSATVLEKLLPQLNGTILFWLDSHYCGGGAKGESNTPIMEELAAIKAAEITDAIILVDDMCCFQATEKIDEQCEAYGFPSVAQLKEAILNINPEYQFIIFGDIALAYPKQKYAVTASPVLQACTTSRLFDGENNTLQAVLKAEQVIGSATDQEKEAITTLCNWRVAWSGIYYQLWNGLINLHNKEYQKAHSCFVHSYNMGFEHWRIFWYLAQAAHGAQDEPKEKQYRAILKNRAPYFEQAQKFAY